MATRHLFSTTIVSAFPCLGQENFTAYSQQRARYIMDPKGIDQMTIFEREKKLGEMIRDIEALNKSKFYQLVFVSHREDLRMLMRERNIPYTILAPEDTSEMRQYMEERCKRDHHFIDWEFEVPTMLDDKSAKNIVIVNKANMSEWTKTALLF